VYSIFKIPLDLFFKENRIPRTIFLLRNYYNTFFPLCKGVFQKNFQKSKIFSKSIQKSVDKFRFWCYNDVTKGKMRHISTVFFPN